VTLHDQPTATSTFSFLAAYEDGNGVWQLAPAPTNDTYTFDVSSSAWAFAWTCVTAGAATREVSWYGFTTAEATSLALTIPAACTDATPTAVALDGSISNPPVGGSLPIGWAGVTSDATTGIGSTTYALDVVPATHDLVVGHAGASVGGAVVIDTAAIERAVAASGATTTSNVDWSTAQTTQSATVSVTATAGDTVATSTTLYTSGGTVYTMTSQTGTTNLSSTGLAGSMSNANDVYAQQIEVTSNTSGAVAIAQDWVAAVANQSYSAPAALAGAASTVPATLPYPRVKTGWTAYTHAIGYDWTASQALTGTACGTGGGDCTVAWSAAVSPAYVAGSPMLEMPDLSALSGWDAQLQLHTGTEVTGTVRAMTSSAGSGDFPAVSPAASGTQRTFAQASWTVTP
jgi:hypothetical protein